MLSVMMSCYYSGDLFNGIEAVWSFWCWKLLWHNVQWESGLLFLWRIGWPRRPLLTS